MSDADRSREIRNAATGGRLTEFTTEIEISAERVTHDARRGLEAQAATDPREGPT